MMEHTEDLRYKSAKPESTNVIRRASGYVNESTDMCGGQKRF